MKKIFTIGLLALTSYAAAQWNTNPAVNLLVSTAVFDQQDVRLVSDTKGGAIISWVDFRANGTLSDIYVQRVNAAGYPTWTANGVAVCNNPFDQQNISICEAPDGGAILCWQDGRNGNWDIFAQKIDSSGMVKWTANGVSVCVKALHQQSPKIVSDQAGGAYVVWEDSIAGFYDVYAQHLDANGTSTWATNGLAICTSLDKQINPRIEIDGAGGCIITWMDKRFGDYDVYAQRVDAAGTLQWTANGILVASAAGNQSNPKIEPDGSGGAVIVWQDLRNGNDYDVYAQRINASGATQWASGGVVVCSVAGSSQSAVEACTDNGINGSVIAWKDARSGNSQVYMQMLNNSGAAQWTANGVLVGNGINPNLCSDGSGGVIVTWQDSTSGDWNVYGQRYSSAGAAMWGAGGVAVGIAASNQTSPKNISDGSGGSIFAFQDKRTGDFDVYAHHLYANGSAVGINELISADVYATCFPNPIGSNSAIEFKAAGNREWEIEIYDANGKLLLEEKINNSIRYKLDMNDFAPGIYFYRAVNADGRSGSGKFISE